MQNLLLRVQSPHQEAARQNDAVQSQDPLFPARAAIRLRSRWQGCNAAEIPQELCWSSCDSVSRPPYRPIVLRAECGQVRNISTPRMRAHGALPGALRRANLTFISRCGAFADCVSWMHQHELPNKHAGTAAGLIDPPGLGGAIEYGGHVPGRRAACLRFAADELFNFYCVVAVHDLSRVIHLFV